VKQLQDLPVTFPKENFSNSAIDLLHLSDTQLIEATRRGNQSAFSELVRKYRHRCVSIARTYLRNIADAEDQAQIALLKAYQHLDQYKGEAEFSTWLTQIVINQCLMLIRERRRAQLVSIDEDNSNLDRKPVQLPSPGLDPEREAVSRQLTDAIKREINYVPPFLRKVLVLRDLQGLPMIDVANELGTSLSAAKSRLVRARAVLREQISRQTARPANRYGSAIRPAAEHRDRVHGAIAEWQVYGRSDRMWAIVRCNGETKGNVRLTVT
jgi:RNA polymerase sigma-70 factor (ECF subfamily)